LTTESSKIQILKKIKDIKNIDGSLISVLLVTQTVSEGVDLKNIREVHILDPWWNMGGQIKL
jgi:Rad3-related DNA helicase